MSKSMSSPNNVPLPFFEQTTPVVAPSDERVQHIASFMVDVTEPEHVFSEQPVIANLGAPAEISLHRTRPRYDVVLDPDASEAAQDQGWGRKAEYRKPEEKKPEKQARISTRPIESRYTGIGQEPPLAGPSTTPSAESVPMTHEVKDVVRNLEIQRIRERHSEGGKELTLEQAAFIYDNRRKTS